MFTEVNASGEQVRASFKHDGVTAALAGGCCSGPALQTCRAALCGGSGLCRPPSPGAWRTTGGRSPGVVGLASLEGRQHPQVAHDGGEGEHDQVRASEFPGELVMGLVRGNGRWSFLCAQPCARIARRVVVIPRRAWWRARFACVDDRGIDKAMVTGSPRCGGTLFGFTAGSAPGRGTRERHARMAVGTTLWRPRSSGLTARRFQTCSPPQGPRPSTTVPEA